MLEDIFQAIHQCFRLFLGSHAQFFQMEGFYAVPSVRMTSYGAQPSTGDPQCSWLC